MYMIVSNMLNYATRKQSNGLARKEVGVVPSAYSKLLLS
jgi:hypothetical protein